MKRLLIVLVFAFAGCGGGGGGSSSQAPPPAMAADFKLLFMGNSHTSVNNLPGMVAAMVRAGLPGKTVKYVEAPGWMFLEERAADAASLALLRDPGWSFVVLQAQKYSSSGLFEYSIDGAVELVHMARVDKAVPILFPEWPRRGVPETQRIYDLHVSIARREPACVAPIPQAWDLALARYPTLVLHDADGNHSAPAGAFLAALILATTMTGVPPGHLPSLAGLGVDDDVQARLRGVAAETVLVYPPRQWCPADPYAQPAA
jgi:hypothetical protein